MHKKAQYVDGKLIDRKGQIVDSITTLKPPPPPVVVEGIKVKRKNISISLKTWESWKEIKGTKKWDTILNEALVLFNKVKNLEDIITQIALQKPTFVQGAGYRTSSSKNITRIPIAKFGHTPLGNRKKVAFLDEINELVKTLEKEEKDIRSILTPLSQINQEDIQLNEEVLEKKMKEAEKRSSDLREKKGMCP